ncbi:MAG: transposase [Sinobacteraceae bacterium]|nr:transposase [Nevskiaceae bacterium]
MNRPPIAVERLALTSSGQVRYTLKTPYRDGTTHIVLEPSTQHATSCWTAQCYTSCKLFTQVSIACSNSKSFRS